MPQNPQQPVDVWKLIVKNDVQTFKQIVESKDFDINKTIAKNGLTPQMIATSEQRREILPIIFSKKPDINKKDTFGKTAMHYAASNGDISNLDLQIKYGGDINTRNNAGETPFMKACFFSEKKM